ncbi:MAG: hypothetical protein JWO19_1661 [Bryobacterales bacterium]|nr:hypothetical protein [Bryobacterales bacterium]
MPSDNGPAGLMWPREKQLVSQTLVIALAVVMCQKLREHAPQASFTKQNDPMQAGFFDRSNEAFCIRVQVG